MIKATVAVRLRGLTALRKELISPRGPVRRALQSWELAYRAFVLKRFDRFSRGGGDWRDIKEETKARKRSSAILVDRRYLRLGLQSGIGRISEIQRTGSVTLNMGFTRSSKHKTSGLTIAALATIHDRGLGVVPRRRILVPPDAQTRQRMAESLKRGALETLR